MTSKISIIIPCRNEEKFIGKCLDTILEQDYSKENLEVLVVDGVSEDRTKEIIEKYTQKYPFVKLLENPKKFTPFSLNIGIKAAKGEIIIRMDAHAGYKKDYISKCVKHLAESGADNVGGIMKTLPSENTLVAKSIAFSLSHPFGAMSFFRLGSKKARFVDTVLGGCYKKEVFKKIGLFNENLIRSQDLEFNLRLRRAGGKILLVPDIVNYYYPKSTNLKDFFFYNFKNGIWVIFSFKFTKMPLKLRHYLPLIFVSTLPLSIWPYIPISLFFSAQIAFREKDYRLFFLMPLVFAARHIGYGFGSIVGLIKLFLPVK